MFIFCVFLYGCYTKTFLSPFGWSQSPSANLVLFWFGLVQSHRKKNLSRNGYPPDSVQSTVISREVRLDMKTGGFWTTGVTALFDVRVTHVTSRSNQGEHTATIFKQQENEKKWKYNQRVTDVEMGTFTPLVFGTNGGMVLFKNSRK